jgi:hypothetical protein
MTQKEATMRYIYGTSCMVKERGYDNDEDYISATVDEDNTCNGDCYSCERICPYKEF